MIRFYYKSFAYTTFKVNAYSFQDTTVGLQFSSEILKIIVNLFFVGKFKITQ